MKILLITLVLASSIAAQHSDQWKGLIINESTPEQALSTLGKAKQDKVGEKIYLQNHKWFEDAVWKRLRTIHWETVEGFGGQEARFVNIDADAKTDKGIFENLHGFETGNDLSKHLSSAARRYCGAPTFQKEKNSGIFCDLSDVRNAPRARETIAFA